MKRNANVGSMLEHKQNQLALTEIRITDLWIAGQSTASPICGSNPSQGNLILLCFLMYMNIEPT
jgi:hypothetical protein